MLWERKMIALIVCLWLRSLRKKLPHNFYLFFWVTTTQIHFSGLTCDSVAIGLFKRMKLWIDKDQFCTVGYDSRNGAREHQFPSNYKTCSLFAKLVFKALRYLFIGIHSPSTIFCSVFFIYFFAHILVVYF